MHICQLSALTWTKFEYFSEVRSSIYFPSINACIYHEREGGREGRREGGREGGREGKGEKGNKYTLYTHPAHAFAYRQV